MTHDVARQHGRNEIMEQVKVRAANRATRYLHDCVSWMLDLGIRYGIATYTSFPCQTRARIGNPFRKVGSLDRELGFSLRVRNSTTHKRSLHVTGSRFVTLPWRYRPGGPLVNRSRAGSRH